MVNKYLSPGHVIALQKATQAATGLVTALLVTIYLSPEEQGYFYTMGSVLSSYILLDLGLSNLLVQVSAKRFTKLQWCNKHYVTPAGDNRMQFLSFAHQALRWYLYTALLTLILVPIGLIYFKYAHSLSTVSWQGPWIASVICLSLCMPTIGLMAVLEGSHKILEVYRLKIAHYTLGAVLGWLLLFNGYGLFTLAMPPFAVFILLTYWTTRHYSSLLKDIFSSTKCFDWSQEIGILHKKVALSWFSNYLYLHTPTPIIFYFLGASKAGQFGLSMMIANVAASISTSKIVSLIPEYSHLIEEGKFQKADVLFMKNFWQSIKVYLIFTLLITVGVILLSNLAFHDRFLPWYEFLLLLISMTGFHSVNIMSSYFRAYGKEPLAKINLYGASVLLCGLGYLISENLFFGSLILLLVYSTALMARSIFLRNNLLKNAS